MKGKSSSHLFLVQPARVNDLFVYVFDTIDFQHGYAYRASRLLRSSENTINYARTHTITAAISEV